MPSNAQRSFPASACMVAQMKRVSCVINEEVWMPIYMPSTQTSIIISAWDHDDLGP